MRIVLPINEKEIFSIAFIYLASPVFFLSTKLFSFMIFFSAGYSGNTRERESNSREFVSPFFLFKSWIVSL